MDGALDVLGPSYARNAQFWKAVVFSSALQGIVLGCVALAFFNAYKGLGEVTWYRGRYQEALDYRPSIPSDPIRDRIAFDDRSVQLDDLSDQEEDDLFSVLKLGGGDWIYVGILAGGGLAVGLIKVAWSLAFPKHSFPEKTPGLLLHIQELKSHDVWVALPILVASSISIGLGASVGPEAALGTIGVAVGTFLARRWRIGPIVAKSSEVPVGSQGTEVEETHNDDPSLSMQSSQQQPLDNERTFTTSLLPDFSSEHEAEICNLDGMIAAFGAIFPSQFIAPLIIHELGNHWGPGGKFAITETLARGGIAATVAFGLFTSLEGRTLLQQVGVPVAAYEVIRTVSAKELAEAAALGVVAGILGFLGLIVYGVCAILGNKTHQLLNDLGVRTFGMPHHVLGKLLAPAIGGVFVGLVCVAAPLCLGDGADQVDALLAHGKALGLGTLIGSGFLKLLAAGISMGFGFVGGPIFPLVFSGACMGSAVSIIFPGMPLLVAFPSCLVALPAAFIPAVFTMTTLASMSLVLGGAGTAPVFIACICSYSAVCGMGFVQNLLERATANRVENEETSAQPSWTGAGNVLLQGSRIFSTKNPRNALDEDEANEGKQHEPLDVIREDVTTP